MTHYTLENMLELSKKATDGTFKLSEDTTLNEWRLIIQLEPTACWFLSVFLCNDDKRIYFSIDYEGANDSHYIFVDEVGVRNLMYRDGDEALFLHSILIRYMKKHRGNGEKLLTLIKPFIVDEYHFSGFGD